MPPYRIAVLGLWHLGEIYSAGLAGLGHEIHAISDDTDLISNFLKNKPPLPEPGLEELISKNRSEGRLNYSSDFSRIKNCNVVWLTFDTPVNDNDEVDLGPIWQSLEKSLPYLSQGVLVVVTSQIPVGTSQKICEFIKEKKPNLDFSYVYTPENLRLGEAVKCFQKPDRIVIGAKDESSLKKIKEIFAPLKTEFLEMSPASAEMAKHAINAFLATSVSFINDISDICEKVGADVLDVTRALRSEPRVGPKAFLDAGLGFSGGTLGRDLKVLMSLSKKEKIKPFILDDVYEKNLSRKDFVVSRLQDVLGDLNRKVITLLGLTYKPGTPTLRRSRALEIAVLLKSAGAALKLHDPAASEAELSQFGSFEFYRDPYAATSAAEAIVLITPWLDFKNLNFQTIAKEARPNAVFFDIPNFLWDKEKDITSAGLKYFGTGRK